MPIIVGLKEDVNEEERPRSKGNTKLAEVKPSIEKEDDKGERKEEKGREEKQESKEKSVHEETMKPTKEDGGNKALESLTRMYRDTAVPMAGIAMEEELRAVQPG